MKYYTPTIEEFHVGFEFETRYLEKDWTKKKLVFDDFGFYTSTWEVDSTPETEFRVKCLDKDDIESLGWKHYKNEDGDFYEKDNRLMLHNKNGISVMIKDPSKDDKMMYYNRSNEVYMADIKNKSELERLLKQLNIK